MSELVLDAIARAGATDVLEARRAGKPVPAERLLALDILVLGALADLVRREEVGDTVRIHTRSRDGALTGQGVPLLKAAAIARLTGPRGAEITVDWTACGLEVAQVALGFGANELCGAIADRRGLPIAEDLTKKVKGAGMVPAVRLKQAEIEGLIVRAGRTPIFVENAA